MIKKQTAAAKGKQTQDWQRLESESAKAYEAAEIYFKMGVGRSFEAVAKKLSKSSQLMKRWASAYQWTRRAKAYDEHLNQIEQSAIESKTQSEAEKWAERRAKIREQGYTVAEKLIAKGEQMLQFPLASQIIRDGMTVINPSRWGMRDAIAMIETGIKTQRLAAEMETSNDKLTVVDGREAVERLIDNYLVVGRQGLKSQLDASVITRAQHDAEVTMLDKMSRLDIAKVLVHYKPEIAKYYDVGGEE